MVLQQRVRVRGDPEEPLLHLPRLDDGAAALAAAVDHLLVREHGLVVGTPLDRSGLAIGETGVVQLQEQPLRPAVVLRLRGRDLARPVDRPAHALDLAADGGDVALGHVPRVPTLADGGVLGREAERVVAHRAQDGVPAPPPHVRDDVAERVVEDVTHVQLARRVRQHLEHVGLAAVDRRRVARVRGDEGVGLVPDLLPLALDCVGVVCVHSGPRDEKASRERGRGKLTRRRRGRFLG